MPPGAIHLGQVLLLLHSHETVLCSALCDDPFSEDQMPAWSAALEHSPAAALPLGTRTFTAGETGLPLQHVDIEHQIVCLPNGRGHEARSPGLSCISLNLRRLGLSKRLCLFLSYSTSLAYFFFFFYHQIVYHRHHLCWSNAVMHPVNIVHMHMHILPQGRQALSWPASPMQINVRSGCLSLICT